MKYLLILCSVQIGVCHAQIPAPVVQAKGNCVLFNSGVFSAANSAANLPLNKEKYGISLSNKFGLPGLCRLDVATQVSSGATHLGFSYGLIPFKTAAEHRFSMAFASTLLEHVHAGISVSYKTGIVEKEQAIRQFGGILAGIYDAGPALRVGAQFELSNSGAKEIALQFRSGFTYRISERVTGTAEILIGRERMLDWRIACSIPAGKHELLVGYYPAASTLCIGVSTRSKFRFSCSTQYHPILGISPSISMVQADE